MAWAATEDFNGYADGDLTGESGGTGWASAWSGGNEIDVQGTTVYEGAKAVVQTGASGSTLTRQFTTEISDSSSVTYVALRRSSNSSGVLYYDIRNASDQERVRITLNASGNIVANGTTIVAYSANTWYVLRITLNTSGSSFTVAYSTGAYGSASSFSADSAGISMTNTGNLERVVLTTDAVAAISNYWDYISPTTPFVAATGDNFLMGANF